MIDLHSHILPAIDDGPERLEDAIAMASSYETAGFKQVAATPHWVSGSAWQPSSRKVLKWLVGFQKTLERHSVSLEVVQGMEVAMTTGIAERIQTGDVLTLNRGNYVLLEPPFQQLPSGWEQIIFDILASGYRVLLAHPERCNHLAREPEIIRRMVDMHVGIQLNWKSLQGRYGKGVFETAWRFLEGGLVHCLATDGHGPGEIDAEKLNAAKRNLSERLGDARSQILIEENPSRVWAGEPLCKIPPLTARQEKKRRKRWFKWR